MKLYNTVSRTKEEFTSLLQKKVSLYVCGVTPYDTTHLGHAFTYIQFDALVRYLQFIGYTVTYTQNVTDIDDDILKRARETEKNWEELGTYWTNRFQENMKSLNILPPTHYVKATGSIPRMIEIITKLLHDGIAYEKEGNVYFDIKKYPPYGQLSKLDERKMLLIAKERGGNPDDPLRKNPLDFLLWQKSKEEEPSWKSPWGLGRPGWHIECSAMANEFLGDQIDIHGGGRDLMFPHHESEIAQSESYTHKKPFAQYWMHTAMLMYEGEKMSKSLGNMLFVSDLLKNHSGNAVRYVLLSHHYRKPWEFEMTELEEAEKIVQSSAFRVQSDNEEELQRFKERMEDDLNTPQALQYISNKTVREVLGFT